MVRKGILLVACVLGMIASARCDEPPAENPGQSIAPQSPAEPSAPEVPYQQVPAPISLDDLAKLAARLKSLGDETSAELLNRYVREQTPVAIMKPLPNPELEAPLKRPISIDFEIYQIKPDSIPLGSVLLSEPTAQNIPQFQEELVRLADAGQAKVLIPPHTVQTWTNQTFSDSRKLGEVQIPPFGPDTPPEKREASVKTILTVRRSHSGDFELHQVIDLSEIDLQNTVMIQGIPVPGIRSIRVASRNDTKAGHPVVFSNSSGLLVITTVNSQPADLDQGPADEQK